VTAARGSEYRDNESQLSAAIRLALGRVPDLVLWRNNSGVAEYKNGARVRYGLVPGASDLIGIYRGRFVAIEVKTPRGRVTREQQMFLDLVARLGGIARVVRSVEEAVAVFPPARSDLDDAGAPDVA